MKFIELKNNTRMTLAEIRPGVVFSFLDSMINEPFMKVVIFGNEYYLIDLKTGELLRYPYYKNQDIVEIYPDATIILNPTEELRGELDQC